jgi:hypothetical protein
MHASVAGSNSKEGPLTPSIEKARGRGRVACLRLVYGRKVSDLNIRTGQYMPD